MLQIILYILGFALLLRFEDNVSLGAFAASKVSRLLAIFNIQTTHITAKIFR